MTEPTRRRAHHTLATTRRWTAGALLATSVVAGGLGVHLADAYAGQSGTVVATSTSATSATGTSSDETTSASTQSTSSSFSSSNASSSPASFGSSGSVSSSSGSAGTATKGS